MQLPKSSPVHALLEGVKKIGWSTSLTLGARFQDQGLPKAFPRSKPIFFTPSRSRLIVTAGFTSHDGARLRPVPFGVAPHVARLQWPSRSSSS